MDRRLLFPILQKAPNEYTPRYLDTLVTSIFQFMTVLRSPGEGRQSTMVFTNLPENDSGLEPGAVFEVQGALRVSKLNIAYPGGVQADCFVGDVYIDIV